MSNTCQKECEPQLLSPFLFYHELSTFALPDIPPKFCVSPHHSLERTKITYHCLKPSKLQGKQNQTFSLILLTMMRSFGSGEQGVIGLRLHSLYRELNGNQGVTSSSHMTMPDFTILLKTSLNMVRRSLEAMLSKCIFLVSKSGEIHPPSLIISGTDMQYFLCVFALM